MFASIVSFADSFVDCDPFLHRHLPNTPTHRALSYVHANLRVDDFGQMRIAMDDAQVAKVKGGVLLHKAPLRFRWSFKINAGVNAWIGIMPADFDITKNHTSTCDLIFGITQTGKLGRSGRFFCPAIAAGAVVDMELDMNKSTLGYFVDGENVGIAHKNLPEGVTFAAAVYLHEQGDEIAALNWGFYWPQDQKWGKCGSKVQLREEEQVVVKREGDGWSAATSSTSVTIPESPVPMGQPSKQRWSLQIMQGTSTLIGLVTDSFDSQTDGNISKTVNGWALTQAGLVGHNSEVLTPYCPKFDAYTIVDVEVDVNVRTLRFYINGKDYGVAYKLAPSTTVRLGINIRDENDGVFLAPRSVKPIAHDMGTQTWHSGLIPRQNSCKKVINNGLVCVEKVGDEVGGGWCGIHTHASIGQVGSLFVRFFILNFGVLVRH